MYWYRMRASIELVQDAYLHEEGNSKASMELVQDAYLHEEGN